MNEVERLKQRYAQQIEDGRKIEVFTSMPEYQWYVEHVIKPTIEEYTERIMTGAIDSDKEDWLVRGMVQGLRLMIESPESFKQTAKNAQKAAQALQEAIDE